MAGVCELARAAVRRHRAGEEPSPAHPELALHAPRLVEEHQADAPTAIGDDDLRHGAFALLHAPIGRGHHLGQHGDVFAHLQGVEVGELAGVDVAAGVVAQQVIDGFDAKAIAQGLGGLAASDRGDGSSETHARHRHSTPTITGHRGWPPSMVTTSTPGCLR